MEEAIKVKMQEHIASILAKDKIDSGDYIALKASLEEKHEDGISMWPFLILLLMLMRAPLFPKGDEEHEP